MIWPKQPQYQDFITKFIGLVFGDGDIRWVVSGSLLRPERAMAYGAAVVMAGVTLYVLFGFLHESMPSGTQQWLVIIAPVPLLAGGAYLMVRNSGIRECKEYNPVMALQVAYLAHAALVLILWFGGLQKGAYCIFVAALVFALQIILVSLRPRGGRHSEPYGYAFFRDTPIPTLTAYAVDLPEVCPGGSTLPEHTDVSRTGTCEGWDGPPGRPLVWPLKPKG